MRCSSRFLLITGLASMFALPQPLLAAPVASAQRDAAAAFVATQAFIVGRLGRDCLPVLKREETPRDYLDKWQKENARYHDAATRYIERRLAEIEDPVERDQTEAAYYQSVQAKGMGAVNALFKKGVNEEVCKYALTLIDGGSMNIEPMATAGKGSLLEDLNGLADLMKAP